MSTLPLVKIGGLLIKTLAKPVSKQIKHSMIQTPTSRRALVWVGQATHAATTRMTIWSSGYKVRSITRLDDEAALSRGAEILSESFILSVSIGIMAFEYHRSSEKEKKKEEARLQKIRDEATRLQAKLNALNTRLVALEEYAKANRRSLMLGIGLGANREYVEPDEDDVVPIDDKEGDGNFKFLTDSSSSKSESKERKGDTRAPVKEADKPNEPPRTEQINSSNNSQRSWWVWWPFR